MARSTAARLLAVAALAGLFPDARASAQDTPGYLVEYRAYDAAVQAGATRQAVEHARAAWRAAERELGDDRLTAILAYNYGRLVVFTETEDARTALARASTLLEAGIADLAAADTRLYADYAEFAAGDLTRREAHWLREALQVFPLDAPDLNPDLAPMWLGSRRTMRWRSDSVKRWRARSTRRRRSASPRPPLRARSPKPS